MKLILALLILAMANAKLFVYSPNTLRKKINDINGEIKSSLANFGLVHYGHSIIGRVWYDDQNPDGCNDYNMIFDGVGDPDTDPSPIVLVNRGKCSFTQKARNVEHAGGRLALIMDDKIGENPEDVIMVDDGSGNGIMIPSILISRVHGQYILDEMKDDNGTHNGKFVQLYASFDISHPDNRVEWDFWFSSANEKALNFLKDYYELNEKLGDKTLFTPHYAFFS